MEYPAVFRNVKADYIEKYSTMLIVLIFLTLSWSTTVPYTKANGDNPIARVTCMTRETVFTPTLNEIDYRTPWFADLSGNGMDDIIAHKRDSGYIYCGKYEIIENSNDCYTWYELVELSTIQMLSEPGDGSVVTDAVPILTNLFDISQNEDNPQHLIVTSAFNRPILYERTTELNPTSMLPEFDIIDYLPDIFSNGHIACGDFDSDNDADVIACEVENDDISFYYYENIYDPQNGLRYNTPQLISCIDTYAIGTEVYPTLFEYDEDENLDLFITYGNYPTYSVDYYQGDTNPLTWNEKHPLITRFLNEGSSEPVRYVNFNDELSGLLEMDFGDETDGICEILSNSPELDISILNCYFEAVIDTDNADFPFRLTEGRPFWVSGEFSTDNEGDELEFEWNFGDGSDMEYSMDIDHTYYEVDPTFDNSPTRSDSFNLIFKVVEKYDSNSYDELPISAEVHDFVPIPYISGPLSPIEGEKSDYSLSLTQSHLYQGTDTSVSDNVDTSTLEWDLDYDGTFETDYTGATCTLPDPTDPNSLWPDNGEYCLAMKVYDDDFDPSDDPILHVIDIAVQNAKPTNCVVSLDSQGQIFENGGDSGYDIYLETDSVIQDPGVEFFITGITDPGSADTISEYEWRIKNEDKIGVDYATTTTANKYFKLGSDSSCDFSNSGNYIINVRVQDDDGAWSDWSDTSVRYIIDDTSPISADIEIISGTNGNNEADEGTPIEFQIDNIQANFDPIAKYAWDFDYDGQTFDDEIITLDTTIIHHFDMNDGSSEQTFDVAAKIIDRDSSYLISNLGTGNLLTICDLGFHNDESVSSDYSGPINEGDKLEFTATINPIYDEIDKYQWDFSYAGIPSEFVADYESTECKINVHYSTLLDDTEYSQINVDLAVRAVDTDGSISQITTYDNIVINDYEVEADLIGPDEGIADSNWYLTFDSRNSISKCDGYAYEWDFSYDGETFIPEEPHYKLLDSTNGGSVVKHSFTESETYEVAVRVSETVKPTNNDWDIASVIVEIQSAAMPELRFYLDDSDVDIHYIDEAVGFYYDSSGSDPSPYYTDPEHYVEYFWDFDADSNEDFSTTDAAEEIQYYTSGLYANTFDHITDEFEGISYRYQIYNPTLRIYQKDGSNTHESIVKKSVYVRDAIPDGLIQASSNDASFTLVKDGDNPTMCYIEPNAVITFSCPETDDNSDYPDITIENDQRKIKCFWTNDFNGQYKSDPSKLGTPQLTDGTKDFSWQNSGTYVVAVKKEDKDGSNVVMTIPVVVSFDTDGDNFVDAVDLDDDDDDVYDVDEYHTKIFCSELIRPIEGHKCYSKLYDVGANGKIISAIAKIGIRHEDVSELVVYISLNGQNEKKIYDQSETGDSLILKYDLFEYTSNMQNFGMIDPRTGQLWKIRVYDYDSENDDGYIEFFDIEIIHKSNSKDINGDTDLDGLSDSEELNFGLDGIITDPCDPDSDLDGLIDGTDVTVTSGDYRYTEWSDWYVYDDNGDTRTFYGEQSLKTHPLKADTDRDGAYDDIDILPTNDCGIKFEINSFKSRLSGTNEIYFTGDLDGGIGGARPFETTRIYADQGQDKSYSYWGTYYYNIQDSMSGYIPIMLSARLYNSDGPDRLLDTGWTDWIYLKYYPRDGDIIYDGITYSREEGYEYTEITTEGAEIDITFRISNSFIEKTNSFIVAEPDALKTDSNGIPRYVGIESFYAISLTNTRTYNQWGDNHIFFVSEFSAHFSRFFTTILPDTSENRDLWYFHSLTGVGRKYDDGESPRDILAMFFVDMLYNWDTLIYDLTHDNDGNIVANIIDLVPGTTPNDSPYNREHDWIHTMGISKGMFNLLSPTKKTTESDMYSNVDQKTKDDGFLAWAREQVGGGIKWCIKMGEYTISKFIYYVLNPREFLTDTFNLAENLYTDVIEPTVIYAWNRFKIMFTVMDMDELNYRLFEIDPQNKEMTFNDEGSEVIKYENDLDDAISFVDSAIRTRFPKASRMFRVPWVDYSVIDEAKDAFNAADVTGDIRYPSFGSPIFAKPGDTIKVYTDFYHNSPDYTIEILHRQTDTTYYLENVNIDHSDSGACGMFTADIPQNVVCDNGMYNIILKYDGEQVDIVVNGLRIISAFKTDPTICQITDTHIGWMHQDAHLMRIVNEINKNGDIDFVILTGDITHGQFPIPKWEALTKGTLYDGAYEFTEDEWVVAWYILQKLNVPLFTSPGNHDYYDPSLLVGMLDFQLSLDNYHKYFVHKFDSDINGVEKGKIADYSYNYGDYHFISLDSGAPLWDGYRTELNGFNSAQLRWIQASYKFIGGNEKRTFLFTHAPVYTTHYGTIPYFQTDGTHKSPNDFNFLKWADPDLNDDADKPLYFEAVLCGHTHESDIYYRFYLEDHIPGEIDKYPNIENLYSDLADLYLRTHKKEDNDNDSITISFDDEGVVVAEMKNA